MDSTAVHIPVRVVPTPIDKISNTYERYLQPKTFRALADFEARSAADRSRPPLEIKTGQRGRMVGEFSVGIYRYYRREKDINRKDDQGQLLPQEWYCMPMDSTLLWEEPNTPDADLEYESDRLWASLPEPLRRKISGRMGTGMARIKNALKLGSGRA